MPSFSYNGHTYDIVATALTWAQAGAEAQRHGGYLAIISTAEENLAIYEHAAALLGRAPSAPDGGGSRYVWIGGSDLPTEGDWRWSDGSAIADGYANWGKGSWGDEPYDEGGQDALAMGLERWPNGTGGLGSGGQWNDLIPGNQLYCVIEYGDVDDPLITPTAFYSSAFVQSLPGELAELYLLGSASISAYGNLLGNSIVGNGGDNRLYGLGGDDTIYGGIGTDLIDGGTDEDKLYGGGGNDRLRGGKGDDLLDGGSGRDRLVGGEGSDSYWLVGDSAVDRVLEESEAGVDTVFTDFAYKLPKAIESLQLLGGEDLDGWGNVEANELVGNAGNNRLWGKGGSDTLSGGDGCDQFCIDTRLGGDLDTILDFVSGEDTLYLSRKVFSSVDAAAFSVEAVANSWDKVTVDTRFVFDAVSQTLYFDPDGNAGKLPVPIAILVGIGELRTGDFLLS